MPNIYDKQIEKDAVMVYAELNGVDWKELYTKTRKRNVVEARCQIWAYLRQNTNFRISHLGGMFGRHHATVIHQYDVHKKNMEFLKSSRVNARVNEKYATTYDQGRETLDGIWKNDEPIAYTHRVVLLTNGSPNWTFHEIETVEEL